MIYKFYKYAAALALLTALPLFLIGCGGGGGGGGVVGGGGDGGGTPEPTFSVTGKVVDANGNGLPGITVSISSSPAKLDKTVAITSGTTTTTDALGNYQFTVPNGTYTISSADSRFGFASVSVTVFGGAKSADQVNAYPVFSISGKIILAGGTPINGATVNLYKTSYTIFTIDSTFFSTRNSSGIESITLDSAPVQSATTNVQGIYSFPGVRSGKYTIVPTSGTYVFKWSLVPTRSTIGVLALTENGMVYTYNPEGSGNQLSGDGTIIFNTGIPFSITNNALSGQDFEASLPGGTGL